VKFSCRISKKEIEVMFIRNRACVETSRHVRGRKKENGQKLNEE